jgi:hypothetical protein
MVPRMKAEDAAEVISDEGRDARFRRGAAILIGLLAMLLAITGLGAANAAKEMTNSNILASNTYAFFQAKNIRQTDFRLAADELELMLVTHPELPEAVRNSIGAKLDSYRRTVDRYESEPETGEGKKELIAKARALEARRDHAQTQDPYFDYAEALFQIAIVLASVSIVATSRPLLLAGGALGAIALLLMLNGFLLLVELPFL